MIWFLLSMSSHVVPYMEGYVCNFPWSSGSPCDDDPCLSNIQTYVVKLFVEFISLLLRCVLFRSILWNSDYKVNIWLLCFHLRQIWKTCSLFGAGSWLDVMIMIWTILCECHSSAFPLTSMCSSLDFIATHYHL